MIFVTNQFTNFSVFPSTTAIAATTKVEAEPNEAPYTELMLNNPGVITRRQAAIWTFIMLVIMLVPAVVALYKIDDIKNRDTILYAKFLANLKDR